MENQQLAAAVREKRHELLDRWRAQIRQLPSARYLDTPTLTDHIPALLDDLAAELEMMTAQTIQAALIERCATIHGLQRLESAFDIEEVVAEYNILRGCIHDLAEEEQLNLQGQPFHIMNRVFDRAIAVALKAYSDQRAAEVKARRDEYLAFVAHDLRTPLSAISLAGRVLERTLLDPSASAESARMLGALRRNVQHLEVLVRKVLEESSAVADDAALNLQRRDFYLWPLAEALLEDLRVVAQASSTRVLNQVPDDLLVYADASLLRRILQNLIANAIKHTPRGEVSIGAAPDEAAGGVVIWVRDDGSGIPEAQLATIFTKGETDSASSDAAGLGLAIVKTFTEAHGGLVTVESTPGRGSTFRLTLPAASPG